MNKILEQLTPQDFGREMDVRTFDAWKQSMREHASAGRTAMILMFVGLGILLLLGGLIGVIAFFVMMIIGIVRAAPKKKAAAEYQRQLGITSEELKTAINTVRARQVA